MTQFKETLFTNFVKILSSISFLTANLVIFWVLLEFSSLRYKGLFQKTAFLLVGFILAVVFIRPNWFLAFSKNAESQSKVSNHSILKSLFSLRWNGPKIAILIIPRTWFFTTLNYMFLVLIVWVGYFWIATLVGLVHWDSNNLSILFGVLSTIGILSGLFQFYFRYYREEVLEKISDAVGDYLKQFVDEISPKAFLEFLENKKPHLYNKIRQKMSAELFGLLPQWIRTYRESGKIVRNVIVPYLPQEYTVIWGIENILDENEKQELRKVYEEFFTQKIGQIKKKINEMDVSDIREVFILNPFLVDDIWMMITKIKYEIPPTKENPATFKDYMLNAVGEILLYFTKKVTGEVK